MPAQVKHFINEYKRWILLFLASIFLELCLSNDCSVIFHPQKEQPLSLTDVSLGGQAASTTDETIVFYDNNDSFELLFSPEQESQNLYLDFESETKSCVTGRIEIKDESHTASYEFLNDFTVNPGGKEHTVILPLHSRGNIIGLRVVLTDGISAPVTVKNAVLNKDTGLAFHWVRWLFMTAAIIILFLIKRYRLASKAYDPYNQKHLAATGIIWAVNLVLVCCIARYARFGLDTEILYMNEDIRYPLEKPVEEYPIMVQQFDAFQKGQLHLDLSFEHDLEDLDNPYDYSQRLEAGNHWFPAWDHVYKNGKFYSYFGPAPILVIYYPHYFLTGTLPGDAKTACYLAVFFITMCTLLIRQIIKVFGMKINVLAVLLSCLMLPAASLMLLVQSSADLYYIPLLSATSFLTAFLTATLKAYECRKQASGCFFFAAAAAALVLGVASRPTTVLSFVALAAPLYLHILFDKQLERLQKFSLVGSFAAPLCFGAAAVMWYNYARFGSVFDFGVADQLTLADIHYNKITVSASRILSYLNQYWLNPFRLNEVFPFIQYGWTDSCLKGSYLFRQLNVAVLAVPVNLLLFGIPAYIRNKPCYQRAIVLSGLVGCTIVLYVDYCLGGVHLRYVCDASFVLALISTFIGFSAMGHLQNKHMFFVKKLVFILFIITIFIGYMLIFENERNYIRSYSTDFYLQVERFFTIM